MVASQRGVIAQFRMRLGQLYILMHHAGTVFSTNGVSFRPDALGDETVGLWAEIGKMKAPSRDIRCLSLTGLTCVRLPVLPSHFSLCLST